MFVNREFIGENTPLGLEVKKRVKGKLKGSYRDECPGATYIKHAMKGAISIQIMVCGGDWGTTERTEIIIPFVLLLKTPTMRGYE